MIFTVLGALVGLVAGYAIYWLRLRRNKGLMNLIQTIQSKGLYIFLETDSGCFGRRVIKTLKNIAITDQKDFVILPTGTVKSSNLGIQIGHGDLYKSILVPKELPKLVSELRDKHGMSDHEIGLFFEETQNINRDTLKKICNGTIDPKDFDQNKLDIYKTFHSNITGFIHTGLNRVSIAQNIEHLVRRENIMKLGQKNWVQIAIAVFIVLLAIGFLAKFAIPVLTPLFSTAAVSTDVPPVR